MAKKAAWVYHRSMHALPLTSFPLLRTARYCLRPAAEADAEGILRVRGEEINAGMLDPDCCRNLAQARRHLDTMRSGHERGKWVYWVIAESAEGPYLGSICLWNFEPVSMRAELGFELLAAWYGRGVMGEVLPTVLEFGFEHLCLNEIQALTDSQNLAAQGLLERFGFQLAPQSHRDRERVWQVYRRLWLGPDECVASDEVSAGSILA